MHKICAINIRPEDNESIPFVKKIISILEKKGLKIILPDYKIFRDAGLADYIAEQERFISDPDLVVSIGGDGTFLHTVRLFPGSAPIFGINKGRLGFLTEFMPDEAVGYIDDIIAQKYDKTERDMLEAVHIRDGKEISRITFLNDAAISRGRYSRPINICLKIDGRSLNSFSGDGLIVSTSTGSTAYSLSAGGPIITPTIRGIFLIMPICPHSLAIRPLVMPGTSVLKVIIGTEFRDTIMTIDGHDSINLQGNDEILFSCSNKKALLIAQPEKDFYEILREKFNWGM